MIKLKFEPTIIPVLEIGDMGDIKEEVYLKGLRESQLVKGKVTFESDASKIDGTCEMMLGERVVRVGNEVVEEVMFLPYEYFAKE